MLCPPGHSSQEKIIGQFSKASVTPASRAWATMSGKIASARAQFSSTLSLRSPPMKVLTTGTFILAGGGDDLLQVSDHRLAVRRVGVQRVRIVAEPGDADALLRERRGDLRRPAVGQAVDVDVDWSRRSAGSRRRPPASRRPRASTCRPRRSSRRPSIRSVSGKGAVSSPSFMPASLVSRLRHRHPAALAGAPQHGVAEQHLEVAVLEARPGRARLPPARGDVAIDLPEEREERVGEALDVAARQARRGRRRARSSGSDRAAAPGSAASRWPIHICSGVSANHAAEARARRCPRASRSCARRSPG